MLLEELFDVSPSHFQLCLNAVTKLKAMPLRKIFKPLLQPLVTGILSSQAMFSN